VVDLLPPPDASSTPAAGSVEIKLVRHGWSRHFELFDELSCYLPIRQGRLVPDRLLLRFVAPGD
jgi:hypothetical protein